MNPTAPPTTDSIVAVTPVLVMIVCNEPVRSSWPPVSVAVPSSNVTWLADCVPLTVTV